MNSIQSGDAPARPRRARYLTVAVTVVLGAVLAAPAAVAEIGPVNSYPVGANGRIIHDPTGHIRNMIHGGEDWFWESELATKPLTNAQRGRTVWVTFRVLKQPFRTSADAAFHWIPGISSYPESVLDSKELCAGYDRPSKHRSLAEALTCPKRETFPGDKDQAPSVYHVSVKLAQDVPCGKPINIVALALTYRAYTDYGDASLDSTDAATKPVLDDEYVTQYAFATATVACPKPEVPRGGVMTGGGGMSARAIALRAAAYRKAHVRKTDGISPRTHRR